MNALNSSIACDAVKVVLQKKYICFTCWQCTKYTFLLLLNELLIKIYFVRNEGSELLVKNLLFGVFDKRLSNVAQEQITLERHSFY